MKDLETFEQMLTGGHPNSLGRTLGVVDLILADKTKLEQLYQCYFSDDEVVRLRSSNAFKRICKEHPDWMVPYIDCFLDTISRINQPSVQWTLAQLFLMLTSRMKAEQKSKAQIILQDNLQHHSDWIVLNMTIQTLAEWAKSDLDLKAWLKPHLERLQNEERKSIAGKAQKILKQLYK